MRTQLIFLWFRLITCQDLTALSNRPSSRTGSGFVSFVRNGNLENNSILPENPRPEDICNAFLRLTQLETNLNANFTINNDTKFIRNLYNPVLVSFDEISLATEILVFATNMNVSDLNLNSSLRNYNYDICFNNLLYYYESFTPQNISKIFFKLRFQVENVANQVNFHLLIKNLSNQEIYLKSLNFTDIFYSTWNQKLPMIFFPGNHSNVYSNEDNFISKSGEVVLDFLKSFKIGNQDGKAELIVTNSQTETLPSSSANQTTDDYYQNLAKSTKIESVYFTQNLTFVNNDFAVKNFGPVADMFMTTWLNRNASNQKIDFYQSIIARKPNGEKFNILNFQNLDHSVAAEQLESNFETNQIDGRNNIENLSGFNKFRLYLGFARVSK